MKKKIGALSIPAIGFNDQIIVYTSDDTDYSHIVEHMQRFTKGYGYFDNLESPHFTVVQNTVKPNEYDIIDSNEQHVAKFVEGSEPVVLDDANNENTVEYFEGGFNPKYGYRLQVSLASENTIDFNTPLGWLDNFSGTITLPANGTINNIHQAREYIRKVLSEISVAPYRNHSGEFYDAHYDKWSTKFPELMDQMIGKLEVGCAEEYALSSYEDGEALEDLTIYLEIVEDPAAGEAVDADEAAALMNGVGDSVMDTE